MSARGHLDQIRVIASEETTCPECVALGDSWVHLRVGLTRGHVNCRDSSKNTHPSRHATQSGHSIVGSLEPGEAWQWCYIDEVVG